MNTATAKQHLIAKAPKPKPPLNAYNLFLQVERKRILEGTDSFGVPISEEDVNIAAWTHKAKRGKRRHRKTHGKIGFRELACVVANRWKKLDPRTRRMLEDHAQMEKQEYEFLVKEWEKKAKEYAHDTTGPIEQDHANLHNKLSKTKQQEMVPLQSISSSEWSGNVDDRQQRVGHNCTSDLELFQSLWRHFISDSSVDHPMDDEQLQLHSVRHNDFSNPRLGGCMNFVRKIEEPAQESTYDFPNLSCFSEESCCLLSRSDNIYKGPIMQGAQPKAVQWVQQQMQTAQHIIPMNVDALEPTPLLDAGALLATKHDGQVVVNCLPSNGFEPATSSTASTFHTYAGQSTGLETRMKSNGIHGELLDMHEMLAPEDSDQWNELCYLASLVEPL